MLHISASTSNAVVNMYCVENSLDLWPASSRRVPRLKTTKHPWIYTRSTTTSPKWTLVPSLAVCTSMHTYMLYSISIYCNILLYWYTLIQLEQARCNLRFYPQYDDDEDDEPGGGSLSFSHAPLSPSAASDQPPPPGGVPLPDTECNILKSTLTMTHPLTGLLDSESLTRTLVEFRPDVVVLYDASLAFVRELEVRGIRVLEVSPWKRL